MRDKGTITRGRILETAQLMVQQAGYNAVSFRELSAAVNVKAASIHYYFPSKEDLMVAVVERYREAFTSGRRAQDAKKLPPRKRLQAYVQSIKDAFDQTGRMCLCGVLAAEMSTLPEKVAESIRGFFAENEAWISEVLAEGTASGDFKCAQAPPKLAQAFFAGLEGALMSAWTFKDGSRVTRVAELLMKSLEATD